MSSTSPPFARTQPHAIADPYFGAGNRQVIDRRLVLEQLPFPLVHGVLSLSGRSPRTAPCSFMNCSAGMVSVRSRIWRARSSDSPDLALLVVSQSHDAQRENLVDLGAIEQVACALGSDLRIVVKNDGRSQQRVPLPWLTDQHRPRADVLALPPPSSCNSAGGSSSEMNSPAFDAQDRMRGNQRLQQCVVAARFGRSSSASDVPHDGR